MKHFTVLSDNDKLFHNIGDATANHLSPCITVLDVGTNKSSVTMITRQQQVGSSYKSDAVNTSWHKYSLRDTRSG